MSIKQGEEDAKLVKEENDGSNNYIFQKNSKTKIGAAIITIVLVVILLGILLSNFFLGD